MSKLPRAKEVEKVLYRLGYFLSRQSGSHAIFKNKEGKRITLSIHGGRTISLGVFNAIIKDLGLTEKDFWKIK